MAQELENPLLDAGSWSRSKCRKGQSPQLLACALTRRATTACFAATGGACMNVSAGDGNTEPGQRTAPSTICAMRCSQRRARRPRDTRWPRRAREPSLCAHGRKGLRGNGERPPEPATAKRRHHDARGNRCLVSACLAFCALMNDNLRGSGIPEGRPKNWPKLDGERAQSARCYHQSPARIFRIRATCEAPSNERTERDYHRCGPATRRDRQRRLIVGPARGYSAISTMRGKCCWSNLGLARSESGQRRSTAHIRPDAVGGFFAIWRAFTGIWAKARPVSTRRGKRARSRPARPSPSIRCWSNSMKGLAILRSGPIAGSRSIWWSGALGVRARE